MSKKLEALKDAVFYAQQKPEVLAGLLEGLISDVATSVSISGAKSITIPEDGNVTEDYTAKVLSQFGDEMSDATLSLDGEVTGVSLSTNTVTVTSEAEDGSFKLKATGSDKEATLTVILTK